MTTLNAKYVKCMYNGDNGIVSPTKGDEPFNNPKKLDETEWYNDKCKTYICGLDADCIKKLGPIMATRNDNSFFDNVKNYTNCMCTKIDNTKSIEVNNQNNNPTCKSSTCKSDNDCNSLIDSIYNDNKIKSLCPTEEAMTNLELMGNANPNCDCTSYNNGYGISALVVLFAMMIIILLIIILFVIYSK